MATLEKNLRQMLRLYCKSAELLQRIIAKRLNLEFLLIPRSSSANLRKQSTFRGGNRSFRPGYLSPYFRVIKRDSRCIIPHSISQKAKQRRFKCNIPRSLSHKPRQARFKKNVPHSKIGD